MELFSFDFFNMALLRLRPEARIRTLPVGQPAESISHHTRTVVLDPAGRIYKQFDGNGWTPRQLADATTQAARSSGH